MDGANNAAAVPAQVSTPAATQPAATQPVTAEAQESPASNSPGLATPAQDAAVESNTVPEPQEKSPRDLLMEGTLEFEGTKYIPPTIEPSKFGDEIDRLAVVADALNEDIAFHEQHAAGLEGEALTAKTAELVGAKEAELRGASEARAKNAIGQINAEELLNKRLVGLKKIIDEGELVEIRTMPTRLFPKAQMQQEANLRAFEEADAEFKAVQIERNLPGNASTPRIDALKASLFEKEANGISERERAKLEAEIQKEKSVIEGKMDRAGYEEAKLHRDHAALKMAGLAFAMDKEANYKYIEEEGKLWSEESKAFEGAISKGQLIPQRGNTHTEPWWIDSSSRANNYGYLSSVYNSNPGEQADKVRRVVESGKEAVGSTDAVTGAMDAFTEKTATSTLPTRQAVSRLDDNTSKIGSFWQMNNGKPELTTYTLAPKDPRKYRFEGYTDPVTGERRVSSLEVARRQAPLPAAVQENISERKRGVVGAGAVGVASGAIAAEATLGAASNSAARKEGIESFGSTKPVKKEAELSPTGSTKPVRRAEPYPTGSAPSGYTMNPTPQVPDFPSASDYREGSVRGSAIAKPSYYSDENGDFSQGPDRPAAKESVAARQGQEQEGYLAILLKLLMNTLTLGALSKEIGGEKSSREASRVREYQIEPESTNALSAMGAIRMGAVASRQQHPGQPKVTEEKISPVATPEMMAAQEEVRAMLKQRAQTKQPLASFTAQPQQSQQEGPQPGTLTHAILSGEDELVGNHLQAKPDDVNAVDEFGKTPLDYVEDRILLVSSQEGHEQDPVQESKDIYGACQMLEHLAVAAEKVNEREQAKGGDKIAVQTGAEVAAESARGVDLQGQEDSKARGSHAQQVRDEELARMEEEGLDPGGASR